MQKTMKTMINLTGGKIQKHHKGNKTEAEQYISLQDYKEHMFLWICFDSRFCASDHKVILQPELQLWWGLRTTTALLELEMSENKWNDPSEVQKAVEHPPYLL